MIGGRLRVCELENARYWRRVKQRGPFVSTLDSRVWFSADTTFPTGVRVAFRSNPFDISILRKGGRGGRRGMWEVRK